MFSQFYKEMRFLLPLLVVSSTSICSIRAQAPPPPPPPPPPPAPVPPPPSPSPPPPPPVPAGPAPDDKCLDCICQRESRCRLPTPLCHMDGGSLSCGYYQLKLAYYQDCGTPGKRPNEPVQIAWRRCSRDKACSKRCLLAYYRRYQRNCPRGQSACEKMARLHNGGPRGCRNPRTLPYWYGIRRCLR